MLANISQLYIFGEVLFNSFEESEPVLGGTPFNVAWHLSAFGAHPQFLSAVGSDELGKSVVKAMSGWGMDSNLLQITPDFPTGTTDVRLQDGERHNDIRDEVAWDYISDQSLPVLSDSDWLYHSTLALRHQNNQKLLVKLKGSRQSKTFVEVNLPSPWWDKDSVISGLQYAECVKLSTKDLRLLSEADEFSSEEVIQAAAEDFRIRNNIVDILVTRGGQESFVIDRSGEFISAGPVPESPEVVDTIGVGEAFTSVAILGLLNDWGWQTTLTRANEFVSYIISQRGATFSNAAVYQDFRTLWGMP
ncbi:MAG: PfkB family carbohydrate kinase [Spirochaetaceae bacterium]|nr:PfkB family carbohydrate kinase [Spirochaetaceae bacterium]MDT8297331.1 PfkB family carbohydrate kinase [Spirochaetaceae bacterium]